MLGCCTCVCVMFSVFSVFARISANSVTAFNPVLTLCIKVTGLRSDKNGALRKFFLGLRTEMSSSFRSDVALWDSDF